MYGVEKSMGAVTLGIVKGKTLLHMHTGHSQISSGACGAPARVVGLEEEAGVLLTVGQAEELFFQLVRSLQPTLHEIERKEPHQHREELRGLAYLLTQISGSAIDLLDVWSRKALG